MNKLFAVSTLLTAFLVACAPAKPSSKSEDPAAKADLTTDVPAAEVAHVGAELFCGSGTGSGNRNGAPHSGGNPTNCPSGIAMFIERLDEAEVSHFNRCTAFLVAKDIFATNSHCLSTDIRAAGASAQGRISIVFGANHTHAAETVHATQILSATEVDPANLHPDIAFLKLEREVERTPFKLSRQGISDKEAVTALVIDAVGDRTHLNGIVREVPCTAVQNSLIAPQFTSDFAAVATARCKLAPGHSGSPVIAGDGSVHGVIQAILPPERSLEKFKGYKLPKKLSAAVLITNMSCAVTPLDIGEPAGVCANPIPSQLELLRNLTAARSFDFDETFAKWKAPTPFGFEKYEPKPAANAIAKSAMPRAVCVKNAQTWAHKSLDEMRVDKLDRTKHDIIITFTVPLWGLVPELDQDERITPALGERDHVHMVLQFDLETFVKSGNARVTQTLVSDSGLLSSQPSTYDLPLCSK